MLAGQVILAVMPLTGAGLPSLDASALRVIPVALTGIVMLWLGSVVEGALPMFRVAGALAVVGGGRVWRRLAAVAVIAGLVGALSHLL